MYFIATLRSHENSSFRFGKQVCNILLAHIHVQNKLAVVVGDETNLRPTTRDTHIL